MSLANQAIKSFLNLGTILVVAAYLGQSEFGLFAVAFSIQSLMIILRDGGLPNSIIQKKDITDEHVNSVFWFGIALSLLLAVVLVLFAGTLSRFYEQPQLTSILWLMSSALVIQAFSGVSEALLRKRLSFARLLIADSGSTAVASVACMLAAALGLGVWSLVLRMVLTSILLTVSCWFLSSWRPRREFSFTALRALWSFGFFLFLTTLLSYGMSRLDSLIIGKMIGIAAAGTFFMARHLALGPLQQFTNAIARVMFPVFSTIQDDIDLLRSGYLTTVRCLATLVFPLIAAYVALSPEAVAVILPDRWSGIVPLIQIIALHGILQCVNNPASQILYARGRSRLQFFYSSLIGSAVILSFGIGSLWGVIGVAVTWTLVRFTLAPMVLWFAAREVNMSMLVALVNVARPAFAAVITILMVRLVCWGWEASGLPVGFALLFFEIVVWAVVYSALCALLLKDTLLKMKNDLLASGLLKYFSK